MAYSSAGSRKQGCLLMAALSAMLIGVILIWLLGGPYTTALPRPFNSDQWKAADISSDTRCGMIADLKYRVGIVEKTEDELYRLLGKPEDEDSDPTSSHWHICPSFIDIYILEVRWQGNRAVAAWVRDT